MYVTESTMSIQRSIEPSEMHHNNKCEWNPKQEQWLVRDVRLGNCSFLMMEDTWSPPPSYLWAVINGKRFEVKQDGAPVVPGEDLALSPDGSSLVTTLPVREVPSSWDTLYPPPFESSPFRIGIGA